MGRKSPHRHVLEAVTVLVWRRLRQPGGYSTTLRPSKHIKSRGQLDPRLLTILRMQPSCVGTERPSHRYTAPTTREGEKTGASCNKTRQTRANNWARDSLNRNARVATDATLCKNIVFYGERITVSNKYRQA